MIRTTMFVTLVLGAFGGVAPSSADAAAFDAAMQPVLGEYLKIQRALAGDSEKGVAPAATKIAKLAAKLDPKTASGPHAAHYAALPKKIEIAASKLARAKGIAQAREGFKDLSRSMVQWASMARPKGIKVAFCSMAKGRWLQQGEQVSNPYYGSKMLRCGEFLGAHGAMKMKGDMKGPMH